jgi:hypothetical protein
VLAPIDVKAIVRTHGGLGNQLFQIFFARLYVRRHHAQALYVLHDLRYPHRFDLSTRFRLPLGRPSLLARLVSAVRIPKLVSRTRITAMESMSVLGSVFLDGYFQHPDQYADFPDPYISGELQRLQEEFHLDGSSVSEGCLVHLRLGDFFGDEASQIEHMEERLCALPRGSHVITNRDDLLKGPRLMETLARFDCRHIPTTGMASEEVLSLMGRYSVIESNNSTLAFWASALTGSDAQFSLDNLVQLRQRLRDASGAFLHRTS